MSLNKLHEERVRPLIDAVDSLRDILSGEPIPLPTIVVIGDQSSGKSSVLESLSGINLPRGQNIVTRCPLVLGMRKIQNNEKERVYIGRESLSQKEIQFNDIESSIQTLTKQIAGPGQSISDEIINLTIYKCDCPDLTLVDLPGITRNPVGDQPKNIYDQVKRLIMKHITPEESVILTVIPANVDFTTSEAIMLARQVDPQGERTIGVITKIDKCEKGIASKLQGTGSGNLALSLGYTAVRNRSQDEIEEEISFTEAREREKKFFASHPELIHAPSEQLGTPNLALRLTDIQLQRIRTILPKVRMQVEAGILRNRTELSKLTVPPTNSDQCVMWFQSTLQQFCNHLNSFIKGNSPHLPAKDLNLPPRLYEIYAEYEKSLRDGTSVFLSSGYHKIVRETMKEACGLALPNFLSHPAFTYLIHEETRKLSAPTNKLIEDVNKCFTHLLDHLIKEHFKTVPKLEYLVKRYVLKHLEGCRAEVTQRTSDLLAQENEEIFTLNHYYSDTVAKIKQHISNNLAKPPVVPQNYQANDEIVNLSAFTTISPDMEAQAASDMQINLYAYWKVVHKRVCDVVILTIKSIFNRRISNLLQTQLQKDITDSTVIETLQGSFEHIIEKRKKIEDSNTRLHDAMSVLITL